MNLRESIRKILREEYQTPLFLRRRFTQKELDQLLKDITMYVNDGEDLEDSIYRETKKLVSRKKESLGMDRPMDNSSYWLQYLKYEMALGNYIREKLFFTD